LKSIFIRSLLLISLGLLSATFQASASASADFPPDHTPSSGKAYFLETKPANVSTFTVNASVYTPTLTVVSVEARTATVAVSRQGGFDLSAYLPSIVVIILTVFVIALIMKKRRI